MSTKTPFQKSLAGEFAVLSQLSLRGIDANLTLGNTKSVDILVSVPKSGNLYRIEVKTTFTSKTQGIEWGPSFHWQMKEKHDLISDPKLIFVFVHLNDDGKNARFFVVPSDIVGQYCYQEHQHWLATNSSHTDNDIRTFRIGLDEVGNYNPPIPMATEYEDAWNLLA